MRIAFFDSGIGGLTVLKQTLSILPNETYIYYADTQHVPYGVKTKNEVCFLVSKAVAFLARQQLDALVIACNTATAVAISDLRQRYSLPVVGMEPAVKPALECNTGGKIMVFATSLTLRESKLETLIAALDKNRKVDRLELDRLVAFAENFDFDSPAVQNYLREKLVSINWMEYETVVLGCTHFIYYRKLIVSLTGNRLQLIDGNKGTVNRLVSLIGRNASPTPHRESGILFYSSGREDPPERIRLLRNLLKEVISTR